MKGIVKVMDRACENSDLNAVVDSLDQFEQHFDNLDVEHSTVGRTIQRTTARSTPAREVDDLIDETAEQQGFFLSVAKIIYYHRFGVCKKEISSLIFFF